MTAQEHFERKLAFEIDSSDLDEARRRGENIVLIDARSREAWLRQRIPGAVSLPHREMSAGTTAGLDPNALIVTYCDGIGCNASTKGALALTRLGFRVKELMGGLDWWKRDGYSTEGEAGTAGDPECAC
jgi:rhodanese-related sulfurtransferase